MDLNLETYICGDINLNVLSFNKNKDELTSHEKKALNMSKMFCEFVNNNNLFIHNNPTPTRYNSLLDVIYTNTPTKTIQYKVFDKVEEMEGSDHSPVMLIRAFKGSIKQQQYVYYRDYNNYIQSNVEHDLIMDYIHVISLQTIDVNVATDNLVNILTRLSVATLTSIVCKDITCI